MQRIIEEVAIEMSDSIEAIDEILMIDVIGVVSAMHELRAALTKLDDLLNQRKFREVASLGYGDISSDYVFLQRTLGKLQNSDDEKAKIIQDIAEKTGPPYEEVEPFVNRLMKSSQPKDSSGNIHNAEKR